MVDLNIFRCYPILPELCLLFVPSLSSCHENATVALYFRRVRTSLRVADFRAFQLILLLLTT